jgi:hypothetical protein
MAIGPLFPPLIPFGVDGEAGTTNIKKTIRLNLNQPWIGQKTMNSPVELVFVVLMAAGCVMLGSALEDSGWRKETVKLGLAEYCSTTGDWAWKGKCDAGED